MMDQTPSFGYRYNPNFTPEPHFIPGYGGYLPRVLTRYGTTYSNASHEVMRKHPEVAARLASLETKRKDTKTKNDTRYYSSDECMEYHASGKVSDQEVMFIPDHVCPGYTGCLTFKKKGIPMNACCGDFLMALGCHQDPYDISEVRREDPFPGPPPEIDFLQEKRRYENGMWKRFMSTN